MTADPHTAHRRVGEAGFTLVEVMVALAVVAIALGAVVQTASQFSRNGSYLKQKTLAQWVGENVLAELENSEPWPDTGRREGDVFLARQDWIWRMEVQETPDPDLRRVDVRIANSGQPDRVLARITAFFGERPVRPTGSQRRRVPGGGVPEGGLPPGLGGGASGS